MLGGLGLWGEALVWGGVGWGDERRGGSVRPVHEANRVRVAQMEVGRIT